MDKVLISYVVPCYNVAHYVTRCINSLKKQQIDFGYDVEFVMVNDGSTDTTSKLLNDFAADDDRVIVIDQENQGVSAARNNGLKVACGQYVFFLDGDDWLTDDASKIIYNLTKHNPDIIISNSYYVSDPDFKINEKNICSGIVPEVIYDSESFIDSTRTLPMSFKAYKKEFLLNHNIFFDEDLKVGEVYTFFIHALAYANKVIFTDKRLMNYFVRQGSVMREYNISRDRAILKTLSILDKYASFFYFDIKDKFSYNISLYTIVNAFGIYKYAKMGVYDKQIGQLLKDIRNNRFYHETLKYFIKKGKLNYRLLECISLCYFPTYLSYCVVKKRIKRKIN